MNFSKLLELPGKILFTIGIKGYIRFLDDETYLKMMYRCRFHKKLDLKNPKTFNEKLQWLKLHDRKPEYTRMVDKYLAKKYIAERIGEEYIIPTLGVWDKFDEIDFDALPDQFVLKCTHDSGGLVICNDKSKLDITAAKKKIEKCLKRNYYYSGREWPYKNVKPRIIAEKYMRNSMNDASLMEEERNSELTDYKVHVFNGKPKLILVCQNRFREGGLTEDFYSEEWEHLSVQRPKHPNSDISLSKPPEMDEILRISKDLAKDFIFSRIDFYIINQKVYFGEITFFPASGLERFVPEKWDYEFGNSLRLS